MCQVDEEYNGQFEHREGPRVSKKCVKCKEGQAALIIRAGDAFCRVCFKDYFIHKFRAMLGKNRVIFPGEKVLLAVSGGPSSCAMLNQVQEGLSRDAPKKLRFTPGIVYIDEGGTTGLSLQERQKAMAELRTVFRATGFPFHMVPLEQVLQLPSSVLEPVLPDADGRTDEVNYKSAVDRFLQRGENRSPSSSCNPEAEVDLSGLCVQEGHPTPVPVGEADTLSLQRLLGSVRSLTAREDLLQLLRQHLLVHTARSQGYTKLMTGESCSRLAVRLLANISLGRGAQLASDTGFSDPRHGDIVTVRPMREYSAKEISFYNRLFSVPSVFIPTLETKTPDKASIQRLTESFVTRLQTDFPSTVSTIYRTGEKLQTSSSSQTSSSPQTSARCLLCLCSLDTAVEEASAFQATLISEQLSERRSTPSKGPAAAAQGPPAPPAQGQCCSSGEDQGGGCCGGDSAGCSSALPPQIPELKALLCYSCRLTARDMSSLELLPDYIVSEARRRTRRAQMRQEISEFLLDEEEDEEANPS